MGLTFLLEEHIMALFLLQFEFLTGFTIFLITLVLQLSRRFDINFFEHRKWRIWNRERRIKNFYRGALVIVNRFC